MTPQKQLLKHDPENGVYGDCVRTALASLLDLPASQVPHFFENGATDTDTIWRNIDAYLAHQHGLRHISFGLPATMTFDDVTAVIGGNNPDAYYLVFGTSPAGSAHVVVCCGTRMVSDPAWRNTGLTGPGAEGWGVVFLVPVAMIRK